MLAEFVSRPEAQELHEESYTNVWMVLLNIC